MQSYKQQRPDSHAAFYSIQQRPGIHAAYKQQKPDSHAALYCTVHNRDQASMQPSKQQSPDSDAAS